MTGLRRRQLVGQYRIEQKLAEGGFADVYRAYDTVEGIPVAFKVPHADLVGKQTLEQFRREVRLVAKLDHPNILGIKTAGMIDGRFVIVSSLGVESLADRMQRRMARTTARSFALQLAAALAYSHRHRVVHCDVKPENLIVFPENKLRLADFGLAKVALRTLEASGSGTVGYLAPEQALGKPSPRSDVFSAGLVIWRVCGGQLPEWPFRWPYPGSDRVRRGWSRPWIEVVRRATQVDDKRRFASGMQLLAALERAAPRAIR